MFDWFKNTFINGDRYKTNSEAVIIACFYNPLNSPYRLLAFQKWYKSIKHLNHQIIECVIGKNAKPQLPHNKYISRISADTLLWHKEALLNCLLRELPKKFKYVFWLDTDVIFTNPDWLVEGVAQLEINNIIQPFEYCVHLKRNQLKPDFDVNRERGKVSDPTRRHPEMWRSFSANFVTAPRFANDKNYDRHGHVGFAWAARREILDKMPLYDKALIGGADHIIAHAAAGHIPHDCITKSFTDNIKEVEQWSRSFYKLVQGKIGYVRGDLYHIWHGEIQNRQYLKRIRDFTPQTKQITQKDKHGLYTRADDNTYMEQYYRQREVVDLSGISRSFEDDFSTDMGYSIHEIVDLFGPIGRPIQPVRQDSVLDAPIAPEPHIASEATIPATVPDDGSVPFDAPLAVASSVFTSNVNQVENPILGDGSVSFELPAGSSISEMVSAAENPVLGDGSVSFELPADSPVSENFS